MEIQISPKYCIITPLCPKIDKRQADRIKNELNRYSDKQFGINLSFVHDCTIEFVEILKNLNAGCFNIQSDIFSLFNIMKVDKCIPLYATEEDFKQKKHQLINRNFQLV